jgi:hypothetical protein
MTDLSLRVFDSVLDMLSNENNPTPIVRLNRVVPFKHTKVYAKLEWYNPFGAVKDRIAANLVRDAEERGVKLENLVEPTSGNTGMGLAMIANAKKLCAFACEADREGGGKRVASPFSLESRPLFHSEALLEAVAHCDWSGRACRWSARIRARRSPNTGDVRRSRRYATQRRQDRILVCKPDVAGDGWVRSIWP